VRCSTAEMKSYARYNNGAWQEVTKQEWKRIIDLNSRYTVALSEPRHLPWQRAAQLGRGDGAEHPQSGSRSAIGKGDAEMKKRGLGPVFLLPDLRRSAQPGISTMLSRWTISGSAT
jgi:hypothetical protein